jgi:hypothetical protein
MKKRLNHKFYDTFNKDELQEVIDKASFVSSNAIVISAGNYFFELSADVDGELEIYYEYDDDNSKRKSGFFSKEEFLEKLKKLEKNEIPIIQINE